MKALGFFIIFPVFERVCSAAQAELRTSANVMSYFFAEKLLFSIGFSLVYSSRRIFALDATAATLKALTQTHPQKPTHKGSTGGECS